MKNPAEADVCLLGGVASAVVAVPVLVLVTVTVSVSVTVETVLAGIWAVATGVVRSKMAVFVFVPDVDVLDRVVDVLVPVVIVVVATHMRSVLGVAPGPFINGAAHSVCGIQCAIVPFRNVPSAQGRQVRS